MWERPFIQRSWPFQEILPTWIKRASFIWKAIVIKRVYAVLIIYDLLPGALSTRVHNAVFTLICPQYTSAEQEEEGRKRYEAQKMERMESKARIEEAVSHVPNLGNK